MALERILDQPLAVDLLRRALEQATHGETEPCPVGLAGVHDLPPLLTKPSLEPHHLGRLARPLDALERDQCAAHAAEPPVQP